VSASIFTPSVSPPTRAMVLLRCSTGWSTNKNRAARACVRQIPTYRRDFRPGLLHLRPERDIYVCPGGKHLTNQRDTGERWRHPVLPSHQGRLAPPAFLSPVAALTRPMRRVPRSIHEGARDLARNIAKTACLSNLTTTAEEGRDVLLLTSNASSSLIDCGSVATLRRTRRVLACCHRSEPEETSKADTQ